MSRIDDLLAQYCPDGVEYRTLKDVAKIVRGERVTKTELLQNGKYPVVSGGTGYMGYLNKYNREPKTITIAQYGSAGYVNWQTEKFWANDICFSVIPNINLILNRFLYFFLLSKQNYLYKISNRNAIPYSINRERILETSIPVPPLQVQEEIVRILDSFTQLEAELEAELEARRQQYEYYRDSLLDINNPHNPLADMFTQYCPDGVEYIELQKLFNTRNGYTPSRRKPEYWEIGTIPWFRMDDIRANGNVLSDSSEHITDLAVKGGRLFPADTLIVATSATIGIHALITVPFLCNQRFTALIVKPEYKKLFHIKFLFYYCYVLDEWCLRNTTQSSFSAVDMKRFYNFKFPVPPLPVQERIVQILDKFDALVNDLSSGLPAEIQARRQQYEHYRDQLLSFPAAK